VHRAPELLTIMLPDRGVSAVSQGAAAAVAQACDIVLVAAKILDLGLGFEAAVVVVNDLCGKWQGCTCQHALASNRGLRTNNPAHGGWPPLHTGKSWGVLSTDLPDDFIVLHVA